MVYEVEINIQEQNKFITLYTAWIQAISVSECRAAAKNIAKEIQNPQQDLLLDIRELED